MKKKILILIENDIIVRNFILSNAFKKIQEKYNVFFVTPENTQRFTLDLKKDYGLKNVLSVNISSQRQHIWKTFFYFKLFSNIFNKTFFKIFPLYFTNLGWKAVLKFSLLNLPFLKYKYEKYLYSLLEKNNCKDFELFIKKHNPDLIIHPSTLVGYFVNDATKLALELNIPHLFIMNSWDNPSTKRMAIYNPQKILVWGPQTSKHVKEFMKLQVEKIIEFGVAQFEVYKKKSTIRKKDFRLEHKFKEDEKIILYAGVNKGRYEHDHLMMIGKAIEERKLPKYKIIYKPHPWGCLPKTASMILNGTIPNVFPEKSMISYLEEISKGKKNRNFLMADYNRTNDILKSVDLVISPLSTMLLEAGLNGLPVLCIFPFDEQVSFYHKNFDKFPHFEDLIKIESIPFVKNKNDLINKLNHLIIKSTALNFSKDLKNSLKYIVKTHKKPFNIRLLELSENMMKVKDV